MVIRLTLVPVCLANSGERSTKGWPKMPWLRVSTLMGLLCARAGIGNEAPIADMPERAVAPLITLRRETPGVPSVWFFMGALLLARRSRASLGQHPGEFRGHRVGAHQASPGRNPPPSRVRLANQCAFEAALHVVAL